MLLILVDVLCVVLILEEVLDVDVLVLVVNDVLELVEETEVEVD